MSKVILYQAFAKDTFPINSATIVTGWLPGQGMQLTSTGEYAEIGSVDNVMFIALDDEDEVKTPPSASIVTGVYGSGTKFIIDHSEEVAASNAARAYASNVESASMNQLLYMGTDGKWTTTASGSVKGQLFQIPSSDNSYGLGVILRF